MSESNPTKRRHHSSSSSRHRRRKASSSRHGEEREDVRSRRRRESRRNGSGRDSDSQSAEHLSDHYESDNYKRHSSSSNMKRKRRDERVSSSDRKKKKKTHTTSSSHNREEERKKRHSHHKKEKRDARDKNDHEKKRRHRSKDKDESSSKSRKRKTTFDVSNLYPIGPMATSPPSETIDPELDYFAFHTHLRLFLYRNKEGTLFEDLTSTESRKHFKEFCETYNSGSLEQVYYKKDASLIPQEALEQCKRTKHSWNFSTSTTEKQSLDLIKAGVKKQTDYEDQSKKVGKFQRSQEEIKNPTGVCKIISKESGKPIQSTEARMALIERMGLQGIKPGEKIKIAKRQD